MLTFVKKFSCTIVNLKSPHRPQIDNVALDDVGVVVRVAAKIEHRLSSSRSASSLNHEVQRTVREPGQLIIESQCLAYPLHRPQPNLHAGRIHNPNLDPLH